MVTMRSLAESPLVVIALNIDLERRKLEAEVGLLFKSSLSITVEQVSSYRTFECLHVLITSASQSIRLVIVYRPEVYDERGRQLPFSIFIDELSMMLDMYLLYSLEVLFTGDFNLWVDDQADRNAKQFLDLLSMYGMKQQVQESTHRCGYILDLFIYLVNQKTLLQMSYLDYLTNSQLDAACFSVNLNL